MSRVPASLVVLLLASGCQRGSDQTLAARVAKLERETGPLAMKVDAQEAEITELQQRLEVTENYVSDDEKCVTTTGSGMQPVGDYFVGHLEVVDHPQGARLRGLFVNPRAIGVSGLRYQLRQGGVVGPKGEPMGAKAALSILEEVRPGDGTGFAVLFPGLQPAKLPTVCFKLEGVTYSYRAPRRQPL
jgi:hypothetical protein